MLSRTAEVKNEKEYADAEVIVGDATKAADVAAAVAAAPTAVVISLLSGRKPNDAEDCRQVDHEAVVHGIKAAVANDVKQFIHISDYGVYRPELIPQVYKIQVEGELIGQHHGYVPWTIVRPTAYFPYLSVAFGDVKNDLAYRIYDHGEWNVVNPIAREDLAEFIVNQVLNDDAIGRILPVGGPWNADNTVTLKGAGEFMFELNGKEPKWEVITMAKLGQEDRPALQAQQAHQAAQAGRVLPRGREVLVGRRPRRAGVRHPHAEGLHGEAGRPGLPDRQLPRADAHGHERDAHRHLSAAVPAATPRPRGRCDVSVMTPQDAVRLGRCGSRSQRVAEMP